MVGAVGTRFWPGRRLDLPGTAVALSSFLEAAATDVGQEDHPGTGSPAEMLLDQVPGTAEVASCLSFSKYFSKCQACSVCSRTWWTKQAQSVPTGACLLVSFSPRWCSAHLLRPTLEPTALRHAACTRSRSALTRLRCYRADTEL